MKKGCRIYHSNCPEMSMTGSSTRNVVLYFRARRKAVHIFVTERSKLISEFK
jgi:hypothetical protein